MLVAAFMNSGRLRLQVAFNIASATEASYLAESAINIATLSLLMRRDALPTSETVYDGAPKFCVLGQAVVALAVEAESGKIDLNAAPPELLQAVFLGLGLDERRAEDAASAIIAYRTSPTDANIQMSSTSKGGKSLAAKEGLFETIMELDQVNGFDSALFRALLPLVTVHSKNSGVDSRSSPPALFAALTGFPVEAVVALAAQPFPNNLNRTDPRFPAEFQSARRPERLSHSRRSTPPNRPDDCKGTPFSICGRQTGNSLRFGKSGAVNLDTPDRLRAIGAAKNVLVADC